MIIVFVDYGFLNYLMTLGGYVSLCMEANTLKAFATIPYLKWIRIVKLFTSRIFNASAVFTPVAYGAVSCYYT